MPHSESTVDRAGDGEHGPGMARDPVHEGHAEALESHGRRDHRRLGQRMAAVDEHQDGGKVVIIATQAKSSAVPAMNPSSWRPRKSVRVST